jgi:hypothetical protein
MDLYKRPILLAASAVALGTGYFYYASRMKRESTTSVATKAR